MYLDNKYTKTYYRIVTRATTRTLTEYSENHHIIPKSLGGSDDISNLVTLTAKEHFICHLLLTKMTTEKNKSKMCQAAWMMVSSSSGQFRYKVTGKMYKILKEQMSLSKKGITTWNKGKSPSDETKKKLRAATLNYLVRVGKITVEEAEIRKEQPLVNSTEPKIRKPRKSASGWKWSEEAKKRLSESRMGRIPWNKGKSRI